MRFMLASLGCVLFARASLSPRRRANPAAPAGIMTELSGDLWHLAPTSSIQQFEPVLPAEPAGYVNANHRMSVPLRSTRCSLGSLSDSRVVAALLKGQFYV
jgi:hypothetical protein